MITEENKNLLFIDLSSRFSYGVKAVYTTLSDNMPKVWDVIGLPAVGLVDIVVPGRYRFAAVPVEEIKPYLRPMSSMTKEELAELLDGENSDFDGKSGLVKKAMLAWSEGNDLLSNALFSMQYAKTVDWLNKHHFDYRGLIPMGLAIEAPEGIY